METAGGWWRRAGASEDDDPLPLSALQHWSYCPRQCALIHLDQAFDDNVYTLRGHAVHRQVDKAGVEVRRNLRVERALPLWHDGMNLIGKADAVEFESDGTPYPVEYKHGSRNKAATIAACDDVQLAAQALCLESMFGRTVGEGALYYASSKRRRVVRITPALRANVAEAVSAVRALLCAGVLPPPVADPRRCKDCSLRERCQPAAAAAPHGGDGQALFDIGDA